MKLVLFDIDGTLLTMHSGLSKRLFNEVIFEIYGLNTPLELMPDFSGMTDLSILRSFSEIHKYDFSNFEKKLDQIIALKLKIFKEYCTPKYINLHKGVNELIREFENNENIVLGLLTGNAKLNAYQKIESYNLAKHFPFGAFGDDNENRNMLPPIAIKKANEYIKKDLFNTSNTFIIGDSEKDIECSKINNIKVIATLTGGRSREFLLNLDPDLLVENLTDSKMLLNYILEN